MKDSHKGRDIVKAMNLGQNEQYDYGIEILAKKFNSKLAIKIGELFQQEEFMNMNVDTFIGNISEVLSFFKDRSKGILKQDETYISESDMINLIKTYPRILSQNSKQMLYEKAEILDELSTINKKSTNMILKSSKGFIYSIGSEKIYKTLTFLDELQIIDESGKKINSAEYVLTTLGEKNLQVSSEKIFQRILNIVTEVETKTIPKKEFDFCFKRNDEEYENRYGKSKERLNELYVLPMTEDRKEYTEKIKYIIERQANKTQIQKG